MSRTHAHNRTITRNVTADELIVKALTADALATTARLSAYRAEQNGDTEKMHAATIEWCNAAHIVRTCARRADALLRAEGRDPNELANVVMHARESRAFALSELANPAGPPV